MRGAAVSPSAREMEPLVLGTFLGVSIVAEAFLIMHMREREQQIARERKMK